MLKLLYNCTKFTSRKIMVKILQVRLKIFIDTKGPFHAKMGSIQDRNGMDLTEAEDIKKNYTKIYTQKIFMTQIIMMV